MKKTRLATEILFPVLVFLFLVSCLVSCSEKKKEKKSSLASAEKKENITRKPPSSFSDTVIIDFPAAVFYNPDSLQLEKIKAITDSSIFDSMMHDCFYQMRNARNVLKKYWPKIKIAEIKYGRFILFRSAGGINEYVDLNVHGDPCGIILFDGRKKAQQIDMTNIDTELGFYFAK